MTGLYIFAILNCKQNQLLWGTKHLFSAVLHSGGDQTPLSKNAEETVRDRDVLFFESFVTG